MFTICEENIELYEFFFYNLNNIQQLRYVLLISGDLHIIFGKLVSSIDYLNNTIYMIDIYSTHPHTYCCVHGYNIVGLVQEIAN